MANNIITKKVRLNGVSPIMFDRFKGEETIPPNQKLYFGKDNKTLILPSSNIIGFLNSRTSHSCLRAFTNNKEWKIRSPEIYGSLAISPSMIDFINGSNQSIVFEDWTDNVYIDTRMARPSETARVLVSRPVLDLPWSLSFTLYINPTEFVTEERILEWFERGGFTVGLCAHRPLFGRFETVWET